MKTRTTARRLLAMLMAVMMAFSVVPAATLSFADAASSASASQKQLSKAKVTVTSPVKYTGKKKLPVVKVTYGKKTLKEGVHYTVKYYNNKNVGIAKVKVTAIKNSGFTGSKVAKFRIQPAKVGGLKTTKVTQTYVKLAWKEVKGATGYVLYVYDPGSGIYTRLKAVKKLSAIATKLTAGKTYRFAVRAYTRVDGKNYFGTYSKLRKVTTAAVPVPTTQPSTTAPQPTSEQPTSQQPTSEQPTSQQPTSEQPTSEQPTSEQPTSEQPTSQEPTTQPSVPLSKDPVTGLKAQKSGDSVVLTWTPVAGATGYEVCTYDSVNKTYTALQTASGATSTVTGLKKQQVTTFAVRAYQTANGATEYGAYSDTVDVTVYNVDYYAAVFKKGEYTVEMKILADDEALGMEKMTLAAKNGNINMKTTIKDESIGTMDAEVRYIKSSDKLYVNAMGMWIDGKSILGEDSEMVSQMNIFGTLDLDDLDNVGLGVEKIDGTMYTVETVTGKTAVTKFYYSGDTLKRIVVSGNGLATTIEILSFSPKAADSLFTEPDPLLVVDLSGLM